MTDPCQWFKEWSEDNEQYETCRIVSKDTNCQGLLDCCQYPTELDAQERADMADWKAEHEKEEKHGI